MLREGQQSALSTQQSAVNIQILCSGFGTLIPRTHHWQTAKA